MISESNVSQQYSLSSNDGVTTTIMAEIELEYHIMVLTWVNIDKTESTKRMTVSCDIDDTVPIDEEDIITRVKGLVIAECEHAIEKAVAKVTDDFQSRDMARPTLSGSFSVRLGSTGQARHYRLKLGVQCEEVV